MNPIIRMAAESTEMGWLLGATTLVFFASFLGWVAWVYAPSMRTTWEAHGRMPLDDATGGDR